MRRRIARVAGHFSQKRDRADGQLAAVVEERGNGEGNFILATAER